MGVLTPQTKNTANIPTLMLFQNGTGSIFQNGNLITFKQLLQAIINVILKD